MATPGENSSPSAERERHYDDFVALLSRNDLAIRRFVRFLLPSRDGVDDVVQETALECWKKFADFQSASVELAAEEFVRWACVIARFKALSWQRDRSRDRLVFREAVIEQLSRAATERHSQLDEQRLAVEACLEQLPTDQRRLVLSVHAPGESIARIAQETGEKARRLYSRVNALRSILLECVERRLAGVARHG
ncbi:MAG: sigma-70 family RNA polymerase sigma factor [Planctomycetaceae bacterium]|nr:sigma-70 family RNA polymerase sigma factor [Planctomycetaceae bacterium]